MSAAQYTVYGRAEERNDLHYAAKKNNLPKIERLLSLGADVNFKDLYQKSPLNSVSCLSRLDSHIQTIELLLNTGADVNTQDL